LKVTYTEEAVADIVEAITYLNEHNPAAAAKLDAEITRPSFGDCALGHSLRTTDICCGVGRAPSSCIAASSSGRSKSGLWRTSSMAVQADRNKSVQLLPRKCDAVLA
jgi:hypothetical protein